MSYKTKLLHLKIKAFINRPEKPLSFIAQRIQDSLTLQQLLIHNRDSTAKLETVQHIEVFAKPFNTTLSN